MAPSSKTSHRRVAAFVPRDDEDTEEASDTVYLLGGCGQRGCGDGRAVSATFNAPSDLCCLGDTDGSLVLSDTQNNTLRFLVSAPPSPHRHPLHTMTHEPNVFSLRNSPLSSPRGLAVTTSWGPDATFLFVCDSGHHTIQYGRLSSTSLLESMTLEVFAGSTGVKGHRDGPALAASFHHPTGICVHDDRTLYVTDAGNHCIRQIRHRQGRWVVSTIAGGHQHPPPHKSKSARGRVSIHAGHVDGPGSQAMFRGPSGIAVGASGELLVADTFNHCIRALLHQETGWVVATIAGGEKSGHVDGRCAGAMFNQPVGICRASDGSVFVSDRGNNCIRHIGGGVNWRKYCFVRTIAVGQSAPNWRFPRGIEPPFLLPKGLAALPSHHAWYNNGGATNQPHQLVVGVCDTGNHVMRVITLATAMDERPSGRKAALPVVTAAEQWLAEPVDEQLELGWPVVDMAKVAPLATCIQPDDTSVDDDDIDDEPGPSNQLMEELQRLRDENQQLRHDQAEMQHTLAAAIDHIERLAALVAAQHLSHGPTASS
ncbi:Aste57867_21067 [Aphanomyces stellatus]|uniref:Aste57867_21067 protein n=1 Tax=Aphanomyces stellatus TaxID=120398 RepID=A0A485LGM9_9STRA|nr:hypothetical protein As57867_020999 [Aphanomyces stellatus]VFT97742.1 Aste57867_21067 [Aphanomyces stellatus]